MKPRPYAWEIQYGDVTGTVSSEEDWVIHLRFPRDGKAAENLERLYNEIKRLIEEES